MGPKNGLTLQAPATTVSAEPLLAVVTAGSAPEDPEDTSAPHLAPSHHTISLTDVDQYSAPMPPAGTGVVSPGLIAAVGMIPAREFA